MWMIKAEPSLTADLYWNHAKSTWLSVKKEMILGFTRDLDQF